MIVIIDYGISNIRSVVLAFQEVTNQKVIVSAEADTIQLATKLILPGVCSYKTCIQRLQLLGLTRPIKTAITEKRIPFLGICVGFQVLSCRGHEHDITNGLGVIPGEVIKLESHTVPHMGWNKCQTLKPSKVFASKDEYFYFAHSFHFDGIPSEARVLETTQGAKIVAGIEKENIYGCQFHPERSGNQGLEILRNFCGLITE